MGFEMTINYITITTIILNTPLQLLQKVTSLFFVAIEKKIKRNQQYFKSLWNKFCSSVFTLVCYKGIKFESKGNNSNLLHTFLFIQ